MIDKKSAMYQCVKCAKVLRQPMRECPICGSKEIAKKPIVETK